MRALAWTLAVLASSAGCLRAPELRGCAEFAVDTAPDVCGDACGIYCDALVAACPGEVGGDDPLATCRGNCLEMNAGGSFGDLTGDTVQCRIQHAVLARDDPSTHCPAAGFGGGEICEFKPCEEYCALVVEGCPTMFGGEEQCLESCAAFPSGAVDANTVECRLAAARLAAGEPDQCAAASVTSDGTCGAPCEGYCAQVFAHCGDPAQQLFGGDLSVCLERCSLLNVGTFDDWRQSADSAQCRAWHAGAPAAADPATHCPHAGLFDDDHCGTACGTYCSICVGLYEDAAACARGCEELRAMDQALLDDQGACVGP